MVFVHTERMQFPTQPPNGRQIPTIGQQRQAVEQAVSQAAQQLSLQIYAQLAVQHIGQRDQHQETEPERLRQLARDAQQAGTSFFEGIGVIPADSQNETPQKPV